jgi:hypothetical protein
MLSILSLQVRIYNISLCVYIYIYIYIISSIWKTYHLSRSYHKMRIHSISLSFLVPIFAVLAYKHFSSIAFFSSPITSSMGGHHHHQHKQHPKKGRTVVVSVCDDFPDDFPPPETNTTSYICVDQNGCCNFTTVQAAVDAVPNFSLKRSIIWINNGVYL